MTTDEQSPSPDENPDQDSLFVDDQVPPSQEVLDRYRSFIDREVDGQLDNLLFIAKITAIMCWFVLVIAMVGLVVIIMMDYMS